MATGAHIDGASAGDEIVVGAVAGLRRVADIGLRCVAARAVRSPGKAAGRTRGSRTVHPGCASLTRATSADIGFRRADKPKASCAVMHHRRWVAGRRCMAFRLCILVYASSPSSHAESSKLMANNQQISTASPSAASRSFNPQTRPLINDKGNAEPCSGYGYIESFRCLESARIPLD